jgi:hypothetical protein
MWSTVPSPDDNRSIPRVSENALAATCWVLPYPGRSRSTGRVSDAERNTHFQSSLIRVRASADGMTS